MTMLALQPAVGAGYLLEGFRLITLPDLRRFVIVPLLVNLLVFAGAIWFAAVQFGRAMNALSAWLPDWLDWIGWLLWPLFALSLLVLVFYGFTLLANLIASPFNNLLAEKVERLLSGHAPEEQEIQWVALLRELPATLLAELKKIAYALLLALPFLLLTLIPVIGALLWFGYTAWILAVQYSDYPMGNHGLKFREMRRRLRAKLATSLGFGGSAALLALVPVVNFALMPAAVAGATLFWVRELKGGTGYNPRHHQSRVATRCVVLIIDHLSGRITGEIRQGPLQGQALERTSTEDLLDLLRRSYTTDAESTEALEVYLARERGQVFDTASRRPQREPQTSAQPFPMQRDEALAILGLRPEASADEIRQAHRRLIQRLHPDRGGSDYLAAKINEAKRILRQPS